MTDEEVQAVIAHECGHIVCHHVLYHTIGNALLNGALLIPGMNTLSIPLQLAFFHWLRCSEFSADRAALAYTEDPDLVARVMMRLAGGTSRIAEEVNLELFLKQAEEYEEYTDVSKWNKTLEFLTLSTMDHPLTAVRATEIEKWSKTPEYQSIITRLNAAKVTQSAAAAVPACPHCGKPIAKSWTFCQSCGKPLAN
jgi:Zn-dependent protease with chaperone function